jgi:Domain of unknown function (DUF4286)
MIIYNVTINVDESIHLDWLKWMQNKHINEVLATGLFTQAKLVKVLVEEEMGGTTYAVQYFTDSKLKLVGDKMLAFRTELEVMEEFYKKEN